MFTGIISDLGRIRRVEPTSHALRLEIETRFDLSTVDIGASIAHDGVCLTVVEKGADHYAVEVSRETLDLTTLGEWQADRRVNLERALKAGDELGGHIVSGHVDGVGTLVSASPEDGSLRLIIEAPAPLHRYIARKGSIAIDGVSLTVNTVDDRCLGVNIIPHTRTATTLGEKRPGDRLNLEIDMLARYLARWHETEPAARAAQET